MWLPRYEWRENVFDYKASVQELQLRSIEEGLLKIGFDSNYTRKIAQIILFVKWFLWKI